MFTPALKQKKEKKVVRVAEPTLPIFSWEGRGMHDTRGLVGRVVLFFLATIRLLRPLKEEAPAESQGWL